MIIGIAKVEGANAACVRIPVGKPLRPVGGRRLDVVLPQLRVSPVHVAHDHGHVLEPAIVAVPVRRSRATAGREILGELQILVAQAQRGHPCPGAGYPNQLLERWARALSLPHLLEREHASVERERLVEIGDCEADRCHSAHADRGSAGRDGLGRGGALAVPGLGVLSRRRTPAGDQRREGKSPPPNPAPGNPEDLAPHARAPVCSSLLPSASARSRPLPPSRSRIRSPTRRAFAMMVSAGFTAALEGKKLPSTT
jgi:hypothetical protein